MSAAKVAIDGNLEDPINQSSEEPSDNTTPDLDDLIHRRENEDLPPAMPPETEEDFEKAIQGPEHLRRTPRVPPNNAD
jgi:hypothetical protein